jgi:hypothetical protein
MTPVISKAISALLVSVGMIGLKKIQLSTNPGAQILKINSHVPPLIFAAITYLPPLPKEIFTKYTI